jgi:hypothetical protein
VGTQKRQRQKANRAQRQAEELREARSSAVRRNVVRWVVVAVAAIGAVILIAWVGGAFSGDDDETPTSTVPITFPEISVASTLPADTKTGSGTDSGTDTGTLPATDVTTAAP